MLLVLPRPADQKWFLGMDDYHIVVVCHHLGGQKVSIRAWHGGARPGEGL